MLGLFFNGILKIPIQFGILFIGVLIYIHYLFYTPPLFFIKREIHLLDKCNLSSKLKAKQDSLQDLFEKRKSLASEYLKNTCSTNLELIKKADYDLVRIRHSTTTLIYDRNQMANTNESNFIFVSYILDNIPIGLVGVFIALILGASISSMSSSLYALASCTTLDVLAKPEDSPATSGTQL